MVRHVIIGLCSILALEAFFPDVDLAEASHLPVLVGHFREHRSQSPDISFAEFLTLHYADSKHLDSAPSDHQDLPFSKRHVHRVVLQITPEPIVIKPELATPVTTTFEGTSYPFLIPRIVGAQVWQPPRA